MTTVAYFLAHRVYRIVCSVTWGKGGNVTSAGWQVTLCDPIWYVSFRSGEACLQTAIRLFTLLLHASNIKNTGQEVHVVYKISIT